MRNYSVEKMAILGSEMEQMFVDTKGIYSYNSGSAVGCILSGSCRLRHEGTLRVIPERVLYVIDQHTECVENITNNDGLFEQVLLRVATESAYSTSVLTKRERERFNTAILHGIVSNLSIEELAEMCCYSVSTFKRRFSKHYHESPHKWLLRCRLMLAAKIMSKTTISITELSSLCGFVNVSHFIATFRRHFGVTPSSLRNYSQHQ